MKNYREVHFNVTITSSVNGRKQRREMTALSNEMMAVWGVRLANIAADDIEDQLRRERGGEL